VIEDNAMSCLCNSHRVHAYILLEYETRGDLMTNLINRNRKVMSRKEILETFLKLSKGLASLHSVGITHGDVKPDNVLLSQSGNLKWIDFEKSSRI
jgi:serine/threonine protein kinase